MLVVVDTNIIVSAAIARSYSLDLIFDDHLQLLTPEFVEIEVVEHFEEVLSKSGLSENEFRRLLNNIFERIRVVGEQHYANFKDEALRISPDADDAPFFALALKENCAIWSNDKELKKQMRVKVISTPELVESMK